jgi:hypothetical protein
MDPTGSPAADGDLVSAGRGPVGYPEALEAGCVNATEQDLVVEDRQIVGIDPGNLVSITPPILCQLAWRTPLRVNERKRCALA